MTLKVRSFDESIIHGSWWSSLENNNVEYQKTTENVFRKFFNSQYADFISNLEAGVKYFFIVHTGEDYFSDSQKHMNLDSWKKNWLANYAEHSQNICVVFVSGGKLRVAPDDMPEQSHYFYPTNLLPANKNMVVYEMKQIINTWYERGVVEFNTIKYLNALSILCLGYLAANNWVNLPANLVNLPNSKTMLVKKDPKKWFVDVFPNRESMQNIMPDCGAIKKLLDAIYVNGELTVDKVAAVYEYLTKISSGSRGGE